MTTLDQAIAREIRTFLANSAVKLATDHGLVSFHDRAGVLFCDVNGGTLYEVTIVLVRR